MSSSELIQPVAVVRDKDGFWCHPGMPDNGEDAAAFRDWLAAQGLETFLRNLEEEPDDHPAYRAYFEDADPNVSAWESTVPEGEGWFTLAIFDTEDGPTWMWARRTLPGARQK